MLVFSSGSPPIAVTSPEFSRLSQEFKSGFLPPGNPKSVTVYLGRRQASNGLTRFIAIYGVANIAPGRSVDVQFFGLNRPMSYSGPVSELQGFGVTRVGSGWPVSLLTPWPKSLPEVLIYSAVEDQVDPSRFTFAFDQFQTHYVLDCRLQPDGRLHINWQDSFWPQGTRSGSPVVRFPPTIYDTLKPD